jgi:hypothetical protein
MAFTIGYPSPGQITQNLDTVLTLAFANAGDDIMDNISKNNAIFYEMKKSGMYEGVDKPEPYLEVPLMYALGSAEWYEGWDTLGTQPTEGITAATYAWRQLACPAGYNRREARVTNPARIKEIAKVKIQQAQMTMVESFNRALLQGNVLTPGGNIKTPVVSGTTGRSGIEPLGELIFYKAGSNFSQPSDALTVGGLAQDTQTWWRNWSHDLTGVTTYAALLAAFDQMVEQVNLGAGGKCDIIFVDPTTRRLLNSAYYQAFRRYMDSDNDYPFDNLLFRGAHIISDELIPNVHSGTTDTSVATGLGSAYFINSKMMKAYYDKECNFILTDLQKPVNQDGKIGHVLWMGNVCVTNRRKHGVIGNIARSMT